MMTENEKNLLWWAAVLLDAEETVVYPGATMLMLWYISIHVINKLQAKLKSLGINLEDLPPALFEGLSF
jgi:hypothetical protein